MADAGPFEARTPDFAQRVRDSFAKQGVMGLMGMELVAVAPGRAVIAMATAPQLSQQHGFVHAGVLATGMDSACGYAAFSLMPAGAAVLSIEFKTNLLAPARGDRVRFEGTVLKAGRTITVCEGRAFVPAPAAAAGRADGPVDPAETPPFDRAAFDAGTTPSKLVASMTCTLMTIERDGMAG